MKHPSRRRLSKQSIEALRILARHRDRPMHAARTTEAAINYTTAWTLEEHSFASTGWTRGAERVRILPAAKQLLELN